MGNCCNRCLEWVYPNPWEGIDVYRVSPNSWKGSEIERAYAYKYQIQSVRLNETLHLPRPPPLLQPQQPQQPQETSATTGAVKEPLIKKPYSTPKSSPLHLGISAVPPPPPLALLEIAKHKKLYIEY